MTNWVTIRVPEDDRDDAKEIRPDDATHGDCLVAGAKALAGVDDSPKVDMDGLIDELKNELSMAADPTVTPDIEGMYERLDRIESAAKEATQAAQQTQHQLEELK